MTRQFDNVISTIAWAYVILCFDINIARVNLLPNWVAYMMIFDTLPYIAEKQRSAGLLKNFIIFLGATDALKWLLKIFDVSFDMYFASIFLTVVYVYTHFQLLTNLADIAAEQGRIYHKTITNGRNVALVAYTATIIINQFLPLTFAVYAAATVNITAQIYLAYHLFLFAAELADEENSTVIENMEV